MRLQGRVYEVEAYEEIRPDLRCGHCSGWGHIKSKCERTNAWCGWCAGQHRRESMHARLRGAVSRRASGAHTPWPSARIVEAPTLEWQRLVRRRRRPAARRGGGGPHHPSEACGARPPRAQNLRSPPRWTNRQRCGGRHWERVQLRGGDAGVWEGGSGGRSKRVCFFFSFLFLRGERVLSFDISFC